jgi:hypothetical protein
VVPKERALGCFQGRKKKWKGKEKKMKVIVHQCKDPSNHCKHCNINGHIEEKCWKLHSKLNHKKDAKKKSLLAMDSSNQVKRSSNVDEKISYTLVKEVNLSNLHHKEEEMTKLFHIKTQVKKTKVDDLFDSGLQANLIAVDLVSKLGLEVHDHPIPYPLGWVNKDAEIKVTK